MYRKDGERNQESVICFTCMDKFGWHKGSPNDKGWYMTIATQEETCWFIDYWDGIKWKWMGENTSHWRDIPSAMCLSKPERVFVIDSKDIVDILYPEA